MKQIDEAVQALACAIGFWRPSWILLKKLKNAKKNYQTNSPGPVCMLQIFDNNPSRGFRVRAETSGGGGRTNDCMFFKRQSECYYQINFSFMLDII